MKNTFNNASAGVLASGLLGRGFPLVEFPSLDRRANHY